jgi:hypothetical protein
MVIMPTWPIEDLPIPRSLVADVRDAHAWGCRILGLCLGLSPWRRASWMGVVP